jgi:hypothetical protein
VLLGSGFIAGEGIMGVIIAAYAVWAGSKPAGLPFQLEGLYGQIVSFLFFCALGLFLYRMASRKKITE